MAKSKLEDFLQAPNGNIAEFLSKDNALGTIGQAVVREYDEDFNDKDYAKKRKLWAEGQKIVQMDTEEKNFPFKNSANVIYPLLTNSAVQFNSRAYPSIVQGNSVVRPKIVGSDPFAEEKREVEAELERIQKQKDSMPPEQLQQMAQELMAKAAELDEKIGTKIRKAENVSAFINWQLFNETVEWEEDTDKLLLRLPLYGCMFRCVSYSMEKRRIYTELLSPDELVVPMATKAIKDATRISKTFWLAPRHINERIRSGTYSDVDLNVEDDEAEEPEQFIEQHRWIDLDNDGFKEPYLVTVHYDTGTVMRISPNFRMEDVQANEKGEIFHIQPVQYYVKYSFIPSTDGRFYDTGFFDILLPVNKVVNTTLNMLMDAGTLENAGGGFISKDLGLRKKGNVTFGVGEYKTVAAGGEDIRKAIYPMPFKGPSPVLFQLLGFMVDAGRDIGNLKEVLEGDSSQEMTATTTMALIEQGLKVFSGIYKRIHRSLSDELQLIRFWNYEVRNPLYAEVLDKRLDPEDFSDADLDFVPVSDPAVTTDMQKAAKVDFQMQWVNDPYFDQWELRKKIWDGANMDGIDDLQAGQNPEVKQLQDQLQQLQQALQQMQQQLDTTKFDQNVTMLKEQREGLVAESVAVKNETSSIKNLADAEAQEAGAQLDKLKKAVESIGDKGRMGSMGGQPNNQAGQSAPARPAR